MEAKEQLEKLSKDLNERLEKYEGQMKVNGEVSEELKTEVTNIKDLWKQFEEKKQKEDEARDESLKKVQEHANELDIKLQKKADGIGKEFSLAHNIKSAVEKEADRIKISNNRSKTPVELNFEYKVVGDMGSSTHTTGEVVAPTRVPGIVWDPANPVRIRTLMNVGTTNSNLIRFIRETGGEGGAAMVAEAATKPQIDKDIATVDRAVRKVASYARVPEEMMDDIPFLQSYLSTRMMDDLKDVEDTQILTGDNTGNNIEGLIPAAVTYVDAFTDPNATEFDVLRFAVQQVAILHYRATGILLHPTRIAKLSILKDSQNRYLLPSVYSGIAPNIGGIPIIENTAIAENSFLVGDFRRGAQLWDKMSANIRFYDQDRDNAIANMVTIVVEERLCNTIYRPNAFVKSTDFDAAVTAAKS